LADFLLLAFVLLCAGVLAVPIASRFGLGSVLGYLIAGIAISPLLSALQVDVVAIQHFAEFGVVMMLFLVGLELEPKLLWEMRARLLGLGGLQVALTALAVMGIASVLGQPWSVSLPIGLVLALSSTAIVLQTLNEKGLMKSDGGQASFSVLLVQDLAVIPILALLPLLALPNLADPEAVAVAHGAGAQNAGEVRANTAHQQGSSGSDVAHVDAPLESDPDAGGHGEADHGADEHGASLNLVAGLPAWAQVLAILAAVAAVVALGGLLTRPLFRFVAWANLRELFVATALMGVIGIALLMTIVGLSPALGTFLAGMVLANSEYRHELESDIDPFRGLLLGLFFITVGASVDFALLGADLGLILALTLGLIAVKVLVLLLLSVVFGPGGSHRWLFALGLAQAGEFGFVLLSFTTQNNVIPQAVADRLLLVVALSMLLTPLLFILYDRLIAPRFSHLQEREPDEIEADGGIIIAGHGRFGGIVNRMLRGVGCATTVLDFSSEQLELLRTFGFKVFFGDATRPDLLRAAGIESARLLVICIDDRAQITELARYVCQHYPDVHVIARAIDRRHVYELYATGVDDIIRETFDSGVRAGRSAYEALGVHPFEAERLARQFTRDDRDALRQLAEVFQEGVPLQDNPAYVERARAIMASREAQLKGGARGFKSRSDRGWVPPSISDVDSVTQADESSADNR
jgi:CPA2 family monovalent cation:H+ antiporter-2